MIERKDLTRWNRASLTRFRYVDGKAGEYLDILREQLVDKFKDPKTKRVEWLSPAEKIPANEKEPENKTETLLQRQERLSRKQQRILESYHQDRRDWAWEITRTFARACHILTEHTNAYANEGYLGTATEWEHVRRLVEMLDYHPAPPASASTRLTLIAKQNKTGMVAQGFQVKYSPPTGGAKIVFETLQDLFIDSALNELRPKGWNQSEEPVVIPAGNNGASLSATKDKELSPIAYQSAKDMKGVDVSAGIPYNLVENLQIKDLVNLDPDIPDLTPTEKASLWEWKAKADILIDFAPKGDWSAHETQLLPTIAAASAELLAQESGNSLEEATALKLEIEKVEMCLQPEKFNQATLKDLLTPLAIDPDAVVTSWQAKANSNIKPGQIAMICHLSTGDNENTYVDVAEAATIAAIDKPTNNILLKPSPVSSEWTEWSKGEVRLKVSPRWKRACWLHGDDVIHTVEPHGLSADTYICWKIDYGLAVDNVLMDRGRSLVSIKIVSTGIDSKDLYIRIFNENGTTVIDKADNAANVEDMLFGENAIKALKKLELPFDEASLTPEEKQEIITNAMTCAGYTQGKFAKVTEVDKWSLRLEVKGALPQEGEELFVLRPIEGAVLPADYDAVVLLGSGDDAPPNVESVTPNIEEPPKDGVPKPLFTLHEVLPVEIPPADSGGGGGLLPPASLPKIGCFLFPSPMLPLELVKAAVELMLSIGVMAIPSTEEIVIKGMPFGGLLEEANDDLKVAAQNLFDMLEGLVGSIQKRNPAGLPLWFDEAGNETTENPNGNRKPVPIPDQKLVVWNASLQADPPEYPTKDDAIKGALEKMLSIPEGEEATALFQKLTEDITVKGPLLAIPKVPTVKAVVKPIEFRYMFNGSSKIGVGDWVVGDFTDGIRALNVDTINWFTDSDKTETFALSFHKQDEINAELKKVYAEFRSELIAEGAEVSSTQLADEVALEEVPDSLKVGHDILLTTDGKEPVAAKIKTIAGNTITTNPSAAGFSKGHLIINANVVLAGHGESKPEKILGSGNAAKSNQAFTLEVEAVSFTPDATKSAGVAAALEVSVAGRVWEQLSTLKDSAPGDFHYTIRMTEEAYVKIIFGDGEHGRRLPSGTNNIRVRYRVGSGLAGNVPAQGLEKPVNPHPLIDAVRQPLQAAGGGDMENVASLRENAPPTLLALERAVSLRDFSHLAASQSSVWQAKAFSQILHGGRTESVRVVIVPAGGVKSPDINDAIRSFLQEHALPGVQVTVDDAIKKYFSLSIIVRVKIDEFIAEQVEKAVDSALIDHFALQNRKLGQHLYLSEVYKIVEAVQGVENSICVLKNATTQQLIRADNESTVVYLDINEGSTLDVTHEVYQP
jgi:hypothetical protein